MQGKLLLLRKEGGHSQADMAKLLGISLTSYGDKERGHKAFLSDEMFILADFFNKSIDDIFLPRESPNKRQTTE